MDAKLAIAETLERNRNFVSAGKGTSFKAEIKPRKRLAIVTCMDTRLSTMFTAALGLENGDAVIIRVAGADVRDPFGTVMRSLLVAVYLLGVTDIMVVAHTECGTQHMCCSDMIPLMKQAGIAEEVFAAIETQGVDLTTWLEGFGDLEGVVHQSIATIIEHPLMPKSVGVHGYIINTQSGELLPV